MVHLLGRPVGLTVRPALCGSGVRLGHNSRRVGHWSGSRRLLAVCARTGASMEGGARIAWAEQLRFGPRRRASRDGAGGGRGCARRVSSATSQRHRYQLLTGAAMSAGKGLHLGHFYDEAAGRYGARRVFEGDRHGLFFAPSGSGKGTRFLTVNLLSDCLDDRSVIVIDPKAELAVVCAKHRHRLGHDVHILDPFGKLAAIAEAQPDVYGYLIENG